MLRRKRGYYRHLPAFPICKRQPVRKLNMLQCHLFQSELYPIQLLKNIIYHCRHFPYHENR